MDFVTGVRWYSLQQTLCQTIRVFTVLSLNEFPTCLALCLGPIDTLLFVPILTSVAVSIEM